MQANLAANIDLKALLDPGAAAWGSAAVETVAMMGTPAAMQSMYRKLRRCVCSKWSCVF